MKTEGCGWLRFAYSYALAPGSAEYKAPLNQISHARHVASPQDRAIVAPNVDTPYSHAWLDLRAEPVVLTLPAFEADHYVSLQLIDAYTYSRGSEVDRFIASRRAHCWRVGRLWIGAGC